MKYVYWAVKWPSHDGANASHTIRVTGEKHEDPTRAAREVYGMATSDMLVLNLGGSKRAVMRAVRAGLEKRTDWVEIRKAGF